MPIQKEFATDWIERRYIPQRTQALDTWIAMSRQFCEDVFRVDFDEE